MRNDLFILMLWMLCILLTCRGQTTDVNHKIYPSTTPPTIAKRISEEESLKVRADGWTPEVVVHMLSLLEQLHVKFAGWEGRVSALEKQVLAVKDRLVEELGEVKSRVVSVEQRLTSHSDTVRDSVGDELKEVKGQIMSTEQRLSVQVESIRSGVNLLERRLILEQSSSSSSQSGPLGEKLLMQLIQGEDGQQQEKVKDVEVNTSGLMTQEDFTRFGEYVVFNVSETLNEFQEELKAETKKTFINNSIWHKAVISAFSEIIEEKIESASLKCCDEREEVLEQKLSSPLTTAGPATTPERPKDIKPKVCERDMNVTDAAIVIQPDAEGIITVPYVCDTTSMGDGGWVVIQKRDVGDISFYRGWEDYLHGFGNTSGDYWLGLEAVYNLTHTGQRLELLVELSYNGQDAFAHYDYFQVGDESSNYALTVSGYSGTAGDSLTMHNGFGFTTYDRDNDNWFDGNCAVTWTGSWWYGHCHNSNLNGKWREGGSKGLQWRTFTGFDSATSSVMMVRPAEDDVGRVDYGVDDWDFLYK